MADYAPAADGGVRYSAVLARFRASFEEFEAARFDERIEGDVKAGKLDQLAEQAVADFQAGRMREL